MTGDELPPPGEPTRSWPPPLPLRPPPLPLRPRRDPLAQHRPRWGLALALLAATFVTTTLLGAVWILWAHPSDTVSVNPWLSPATVAWLRARPEVLRLGLQFSLPALFILLCHELGHYVACRRYRLPATLPYFLPLPLGIGTLGAFIRIRAPIESRRQLFDVGVAGPIGGFLALVPFLVLGVARSEVVPVVGLGEAELAALPAENVALLLIPGRCLAIDLVAGWYHGPLPDGAVLHLHPFALAAWFGLLVTAMNLLPLAQLDGGHVLYAAIGRRQRRLALPLWLALAAAGWLYWYGWWLWCAIVLLMGLRHPPVYDEATPLDRRRLALAAVALAILVLSFMPTPVEELFVRR